jgi:hypothetical protein
LGWRFRCCFRRLNWKKVKQANVKSSFEGQVLACYQLKEKRTFTLDTGHLVDLEKGIIGKVSTPAYDAYCHVKIVNGTPEIMPYHCSPFECLDTILAFKTFTYPGDSENKTWSVAILGHSVYTVFKNAQTGFKDVLYVKTFKDSFSTCDYQAKKEKEKENKGYVKAGLKHIKFINAIAVIT